jgi:molybdopterin molybdotransferase
MPLSFEQALSVVEEKLMAVPSDPPTERLSLREARDRVLADEVKADRDYPPFHRATRDGYAVRSGDLSALPTVLDCRGEVRAGGHFDKKITAGQCVQIMTGAPVPEGADAVVMIEHTRLGGRGVEILRAPGLWENVVLRGTEVLAGSVVLAQGRHLGAGEVGLLASVGQTSVRVFRRPSVAILPTGDELVPVEQRPEWFEIRNSNAATLAAQVVAAGGIPRLLDIAPDEKEGLRPLIGEGLQADLLLLSGGVSAGKYDFVEPVLEELGAEFYFQEVAIRPGKPLVFGRAREKFFFGLPGNPVSTFVTFELFARPAIGMLQGMRFRCPVFLRACLAKPFRQKNGLTAFVPARLETENGNPVVDLVDSQGSGDLVGLTAANCFLVIHPQQTEFAAGDWVDVLPK